MNAESIIRLAGVATLCILVAASLMPRVINLKSQVVRMESFHQKLFWVYMAYTAFTILWIGVVSIAFAEELATGTVLAKAILTFFTIFWGGRLIIQYGFFDTSALQKKIWHKVGYHMLTPVFTAVAVAYGWVALA